MQFIGGEERVFHSIWVTISELLARRIHTSQRCGSHEYTHTNMLHISGPKYLHFATNLLPARMELTIDEMRKKVVSASLVLGVRFRTQRPTVLTKAFSESPHCLHAYSGHQPQRSPRQLPYVLVLVHSLRLRPHSTLRNLRSSESVVQ
jgi:hypothetical protein